MVTSATKRVLFLCTGNSARSQMAETFLNQYAADLFEAHSAGLDPHGVNPYTIKAMSEKGFDLSENKSKGVDTYLGKTHFYYLITVCAHAEKNCPTVWPGVNARFHWSFEDPAAFEGSEEDTLNKFREIRDQIEAKIVEWVKSEREKLAA